MKNNSLWTEHYRPVNLDTYLGNDLVKNKIKGFLDAGDIPHLLLAGKAGTGKTTLAKILVKNIECDHLFINASDQNSVDNIRMNVKKFVSSISFKPLKIVVLDECDFMSPSAQAALRNLMEAFSNHSRFILTCNFQERIIDPLISRTQSFKLYPPSQKEVAIHIAKILTSEGVQFDAEDIKTLVVSYYPDIRKIINTTQLFSMGGALALDFEQLIKSDVKLNVLTLMLDTSKSSAQRFKEVRETIHNAGVRDFAEFFTFLYENIDSFDQKKQASIILDIAESQYRDALVVDKELNFAALLYNILEK